MKCDRVGVQCLMFADDLLVFSKATAKSMEGLREVLQTFHQTTGMVVNPSKSHAYFSKLDRSSAQFLLDILQIQFGEFPVTYLGLPLTGNIWSNATKQKLYGKLLAKLKIWSSRHLSHPAKVQIINTILLSITSYWSNSIILPKNVYEEITKICRNFLWGHQKGERKLVPVSWETLCFNKTAGGVGIRDPGIWGQALLSKHLWEVQQKQDSLWIRWLHGYYLRGKDFWTCRANSQSSFLWKSLLEVRDRMGVSLMQFVREGKFKVARAYEVLQGHQPQFALCKVVWSKRLLPRECFFLWMLLLGRLSTLDRLEHIGIHTGHTLCYFCAAAPETVAHSFARCQYAQEVFHYLCLPQFSSFGPVRRFLYNWSQKLKSPQFCVLGACLYQMWGERNRRDFGRGKMSSFDLSQLIKSEMGLRMKL